VMGDEGEEREGGAVVRRESLGWGRVMLWEG
jgi:hypothetical protein